MDNRVEGTARARQPAVHEFDRVTARNCELLSVRVGSLESDVDLDQRDELGARATLFLSHVQLL